MKYKKIDKSSPDSIPESLDLFSTPFTQVAVEKTYEREFLTLNPVNEAPYNFKILTGSSFMVPNKTRIVTQWQLSKKDVETTGNKTEWTNTASADEINVMNGLGATFIRNLKVTVGGQTVFNSNNLYSYKAYLDNELNFGEDSKKSSMNSFGYYYEDCPKSDATELVKCNGWKERRELFTNGKVVEFSAPLYADIFQQPLFMLSNMEIDLEIYPNNTEFLVYSPTYKGDVMLTLNSVRLFCTFVDLHPGVALEVEKKLEKEPARYALQRTELKTLYYNQERTQAHSTIFTDYIPREVTVVFIPQKNFNGAKDLDATFFYHINLRDISMQAGNMEIPYVAFDLDFRKGKTARAFEHLHRTIGQSGTNLDCGITRKMFEDGYTIFPFNLTTSQENIPGFDFIRDAPTLFNMKLHTSIDKGDVMALFMGKYDSMMFIDHTRTVRSDLTV